MGELTTSVVPDEFGEPLGRLRGSVPCRQGRRTSMAHDMAHERFRRFNTMGRWPGQTIDYDVSLMVRATGRSLVIAGLTGFDLDGKFHGKGDPAAQADQAMKNLKILIGEAGGTLEHVCKVTTYLLDRAHRDPVYNTVARHLRGIAPCGTGLIVSGLAMADMLVEFDIDVVIPA